MELFVCGFCVLDLDNNLFLVCLRSIRLEFFRSVKIKVLSVVLYNMVFCVVKGRDWFVVEGLL